MSISDWVPEVGDVGALLRARTKDTSGNEIGTFTIDTRPTDDQISSIISTAVADVAMVAGTELPELVWSYARFTTALGAAMLTELTYFPEQVAVNRSPYEQYKALYDQRLLRLIESIELAGGDAPGGALSLAERSPVWGFPVPLMPCGPPYEILGRGTQW